MNMTAAQSLKRDSVVTPFATISRKLGALSWRSVRFRKLDDVQETKLERFPKLDVAGSSPVSRSIFNKLARVSVF